MKKLARLCLAVLGLCLAFHAPAQAAEPMQVASGVAYELIGVYDRARLDRIFGPELDDFMSTSTMPRDFAGKFPPAKYPVKLYRVTYSSVVPELDNRPTVASGLVAVPDTGVAAAPQMLPMVSYQHGTVFDKSFVPSNPEASMETRIMIARFAAQGYVVIGADYFGRGVSDLPDSYLVRLSTAQASYDMLLAARATLGALRIQPGQLFLSGWSQGGWATMAFLHRLEALGVKVAATAAASAPVDIALTMKRWLRNPQPVDAVYLPGVVALQIQAQAFYLRQGGLAEAAIRPDYLAAARALYENRMSWEAFYAATKPKLQDFLQPAFAAGADIGDAPYWRVLDRSEAYRWRRVTPLRAYTGGKDEVTPDYIGQLPERTQALLGGAPTQTIDAGARADHRGVFLFSVVDQKIWFDAMLAP